MSEKKLVAEAKVGENTIIEVNLPDIDKTVQKLVEESPKLKEYFEELKEYKAKKAEGKGVVEAMGSDKKTKLIEALKNVRTTDVKEQWTVTLPEQGTAEVSGHLRNYVYVTDAVKGKQGETVNIPYVKDFDFVHITPEADTLTEATSIISTFTTTLKEAGKYTQVPYADIEMIDSNLLELLNERFATAAVRAEDQELITLIGTLATTSYGGSIDGNAGTNPFYARWIPQAIGKLLQAGKDVHPGELVLYITPRPYAALLEELSGAQAYTYVEGGIIRTGLLDEYLGVKIICGHYRATYYPTTSTDTGTHEQAFLMRGKRTMALAPKRDILIETDRLIKERVLKIVGSHTFGVVLMDDDEVVRIITGQEWA